MTLNNQLDCYPALANGVEVLAIGERHVGERIWVGGIRGGLEVTKFLHFYGLAEGSSQLSIFPALRAINGRRSVRTIADSLLLDPEKLFRLLERLHQEMLVHFHLLPVPGISSRDRDATRRDVEVNALPHGASMEMRARTRIKIIGHDRTATLLTALLLGSGIGRVQMSSDNDGRSMQEQIRDIDLGPGVLTPADIGALKSERFDEIENRSAIISRGERGGDISSRPYAERSIDPDLVISIGYPRVDYHQRLISEDRPFLIVAGYQQGTVSVGPFVIPGKSPCLRCFELNQYENSFWQEQARQLRTLAVSECGPVIASHQSATIAADAVMRWIDFPLRRNEHPLLSREWILAGPNDFSGDQRGHYRQWQAHPECGCTWIPIAL
jgi:hypothetical protein